MIADTDEYLPRPDDASLDGYMARMEKELNGEPYLLAVERAHVASRQIWKTAARFLASLYEATGALPGGVDVEVFVGCYPNTIPGIHRERSGVFVSMVQGSKDILVWPPDAPGLPLGTARYQQATETARRLRCQPGRLVYWPAMHWHVGESPAQSTAGLHIAVLAEPPTIQDLLAGTSRPRRRDSPWHQPRLVRVRTARARAAVDLRVECAVGDQCLRRLRGRP